MRLGYLKRFVLHRGMESDKRKIYLYTGKMQLALSPTAVKEVPYAPIADIDFRSAKKLKRNLDETINNLTTSQGSTSRHSNEVAKVAASVPGETEPMNFYAKLNSCMTKATALSLIYPFSDACF